METINKLKTKPPNKPQMKILRGIRALKIPTLQWDAFSWVDMIDWSTDSIHLPYKIECLSDAEASTTLWQPHCTLWFK